MTFWVSKLRKRRKPHRCETCGQLVAVGAVSYDESGIYEGELSSYRQCRACHDIVVYLFWRGSLDHAEGYALCELADIAREERLLWPPVWNFVAQPPPPDSGNPGPLTNQDGGEKL